MNKLVDLSLTYRGILRYHRFLNKSQYLSSSEVRSIQSAWLSKLLRHAYRNVPWYSALFREVGVNVNSLAPFDELKKLPVLTKDEVRHSHSDFCISGVADKSLKFSTSGTTGEPLTAYTSTNQWVMEQGVIWRQWRSAGYKFRDRIAIFRSYSPAKGESLIRRDRLRNWSYFSVFDMNDEAIDQYARYLQEWQPKFLRGYPSALNLVADHALKYGWSLPSLKAALTASEAVPHDLRDKLRRAFGIEVFDHYGQAEITCMFHECEVHDGMHNNWEYGIVELIPTAESGIYKIVATNLHNFSMPLLRYDTGDLAVGDWEVCGCGRTSPKVRAIRGRQDDYLLMSDQSKTSVVNLYTYFAKLDELQRFQLVQSRPGELTVLFSLGRDVAGEKWVEISERIILDLESKTSLRIKCPRDFEFIQSSEGKLPAFVQRVKNVN